MRGRTHFHRLLGNVDFGELLKLMVHTGQLALDMFGGIRHALLNPGDVEKDAAVWSASACFDFAIDAAGDVVAREELGRTARILVALRVPPALFFVVGGLRLIE